MISEKRGQNTELACMAAMLHQKRLDSSVIRL